MKDNTKPELMKLLGITDDKIANDVIAYAKSLSTPDRKPNDYALAKTLNERVTDIIDLASSTRSHKIDITAINKSYVLIVSELKTLYERNAELSDIDISPIWKHFDIIEGLEYQISEYLHNWDNDSGQSHNAKVNKLCIISGREKPDYTPKLKQIVDDADSAVAAYRKQLDERKKKDSVDTRDWFIPEYKVTYGLDGTILVNGVLKLKKVHAGSAPDRLMEQATKNPDTVFKPDLGQTSRNLSTTLSSMGFSGTLRSLFFPSVSKDKGILYRSAVLRKTAEAERIDTTDLDTKLKELGAHTELNPNSIPF